MLSERFAIVFEIYRYAACVVCVIGFLMTGLAVLSSLLSPQGLTNLPLWAGQAGGLLLSLAVYILHWTLKNPHIQR